MPALSAIEAARIQAAALPLDQIDVSDPRLYQDDVWEPYFSRLRREDPVHFATSPVYGSFWSVTKFRDIMQVETSQQIYSSDMTLGGIILIDQSPEFRLPSFIAMDPPKHDEHRRVVSPIVAPGNLQNMAGIIRERAAHILDGLPRNETFDWVDLVSVELTTQMLATLFDYPFEQRRQLTYWSNVAICNPNAPDAIVRSEEERFAEMQKMAEAMFALWKERANAPPRYDLMSMLAHGEATRNLPSRPHELMGTLVLLIVGGNDTTRNTISGSVWALNRHPDEYRKLRENPGLIPSLVPEVIRWHTPVLYMRRTATRDTELGGKFICEGDKVAMWYVSGNRDETEIERANEFIIDRARAAPPLVVRLRRPSLCRQPAGGAAADDPVGGDPEAPPADRADGRAEARLLQLHPRHLVTTGAHLRLITRLPLKPRGLIDHIAQRLPTWPRRASGEATSQPLLDLICT